MHFSARVFGNNQAMTWKITDNVAQKKDTEVDKRLENRRYVSQRWLLFRKARGVMPPPVYKFENVNELAIPETLPLANSELSLLITHNSFDFPSHR
jgi:hypothetical protein